MGTLLLFVAALVACARIGSSKVQDAGPMLLVVVPGSLPNRGRHGHYSISSRYKRLHEPEDLSRHVLPGRCEGGDRNVHEGMP